MSEQASVVRIRLTIAYDGRAYRGWQVQKNGVGVQEVVETALRRLFPSVRRIHGSSRTDTGVHALGMVAHVDLQQAEIRMPYRKIRLAVNAFLPEDVRIVEAVPCSGSFHARFDARGKQYRYWVWNHRVANPLYRHTAWHVPTPLDIAPMRGAGRALVGTRDFKSFACQRDYEMESTVRTLHRCRVMAAGPLLTFVMEGDGFLYKMCRGIVGTLVQVGQGKISVNQMESMLEAKDRRLAGMTAPAHGLILWKVNYDDV